MRDDDTAITDSRFPNRIHPSGTGGRPNRTHSDPTQTKTLAVADLTVPAASGLYPAEYIASAPTLARIDPVLLPSDRVAFIRSPRQSVGAIRLGAPYY